MPNGRNWFNRHPKANGNAQTPIGILQAIIVKTKRSNQQSKITAEDYSMGFLTQGGLNSYARFHMKI